MAVAWLLVGLLLGGPVHAQSIGQDPEAPGKPDRTPLPPPPGESMATRNIGIGLTLFGGVTMLAGAILWLDGNRSRQNGDAVYTQREEGEAGVICLLAGVAVLVTGAAFWAVGSASTKASAKPSRSAIYVDPISGGMVAGLRLTGL